MKSYKDWSLFSKIIGLSVQEGKGQPGRSRPFFEKEISLAHPVTARSGTNSTEADLQESVKLKGWTL